MRLLLLLCLLSLKLAIAGEPARLQFSRVGPTRIGLFLAAADGSNEHALLPADSLDYNPSFSADGKWIVFTSERKGSADIFRVHPDGSGVERLTDDPAFDDQGALSPNGSTLAFVSTREGGFANLWLEDFSSPSRRVRPISLQAQGRKDDRGGTEEKEEGGERVRGIELHPTSGKRTEGVLCDVAGVLANRADSFVGFLGSRTGA